MTQQIQPSNLIWWSCSACKEKTRHKLLNTDKSTGTSIYQCQYGKGCFSDGGQSRISKEFYPMVMKGCTIDDNDTRLVFK